MNKQNSCAYIRSLDGIDKAFLYKAIFILIKILSNEWFEVSKCSLIKN